jgi:Na+/H+ antiporter
MEIVFTVLILLLAVAASGVVARITPINLPLPLFQIALGALLAMPLFGLKIRFDPELFLLLFIPPLLFTDGWRIPKREFFRLAKPIFALALGLVLFTVVGVGYFIHWMIPVISLPAAFALAAVISPTDAVAVSAIVGKGKLPSSLQHLLEGEALMNDATGLVAFKFAIVAVMTGSFSFFEATTSFALIAVGGIVVGLVVAWSLGIIRKKVIDWSGDEPGIQVVLTLLIPFAAYIFAEHFELSGILAAVSAGMVMPYLETATAESAATRIQRNGVLTMLEFVFNGMTFILLGLQLPSIVDLAYADAIVAGNVPVWHLFAYIGAITLALVVSRFFWVWFNLSLSSFASLLINRQWKRYQAQGFRWIAIVSLSGVRGAITLAGVMSIPLLMQDGSHFPARDLLIFLAAGVILYSLIGASLVLPLLTKGIQVKDDHHSMHHKELNKIRQRISEAAIDGLEKEQKILAKDLDEKELELLDKVTLTLMTTYKSRLDAESDSDETQRMANKYKFFERELRLAIIYAERTEVKRLHAQSKIDDQLFMELMTQIDLAESWQKGPLSNTNQTLL